MNICANFPHSYVGSFFKNNMIGLKYGRVFRHFDPYCKIVIQISGMFFLNERPTLFLECKDHT